MRRPRIDSLPESFPYRDDGCDIHPACLTCPLPQCRYDNPRGIRAMLSARRDAEIIKLRWQGLTVDELAARHRVSRRTIFRILRREKDGKIGKVIPLIPVSLDHIPLRERSAHR